MSPSATKEVWVPTTRIERETWQAMIRLAQAGDRTVASEVRRALRNHVQRGGEA